MPEFLTMGYTLNYQGVECGLSTYLFSKLVDCYVVLGTVPSFLSVHLPVTSAPTDKSKYLASA
jgi:hypothetical protein